MGPRPLAFDKFITENAPLVEMRRSRQLGDTSQSTRPRGGFNASQNQALLVPTSPSNRHIGASPKQKHNFNVQHTDEFEDPEASAIRFVDTSAHKEHLVPRPAFEDTQPRGISAGSVRSTARSALPGTMVFSSEVLATQTIPQRSFITRGSDIEVEAADAHYAPVNPRNIELRAFDETRLGNALADMQRKGQHIAKRTLWDEKAQQFKLSRTLNKSSDDKRAELEGLYTKLSESLRDQAGGLKEIVPVHYRREKFKLCATKAEKIKPVKEQTSQLLAMEETYLMSPKQRRELLKQQVHQQQARKQIRSQLAKESRMDRIIQSGYRSGGLVDFDEDTHADREEQLARALAKSQERGNLLASKQHSLEGKRTFHQISDTPPPNEFGRKKQAEFSHNSRSHINDIPPQKPVNVPRQEWLHDRINGGKKYDIISGRELVDFSRKV